MAGYKSTYLANLILALELGRTAWTPPATWYLALYTTLPSAGGTGGAEVAASDYSRTAITNNTTNFPAPSAGASQNGTSINCGTPLSPGWGTIVGAALCDAPTGGNIYRIFACSPSISAVAGVPLVIPAGGLVATEA